MTVEQLISVFAILLSPLIAVLVTMYLQTRQIKNNQKMSIFLTLIKNRHSLLPEETIQAINLIDVVFYNNKKVRQLWKEYFEMLCNAGLNDENGHKQKNNKNLELIFEMAKVLGYKDAINHLDIERVYYPIALGEREKRNNELANGLLDVFKMLKEKNEPK